MWRLRWWGAWGVHKSNRVFIDGVPNTITMKVTSQTKIAKLKDALGPLKTRPSSGRYRRCKCEFIQQVHGAMG
jgi:hypothetical protein